MQRFWHGLVKPGCAEEHERFVDWLNSSEGSRLLARSALTAYQLWQAGDRVMVALTAAEPPAIIRFLRNHRFWPECWEFESAASGQVGGARLRVDWRAPAKTAGSG